MGEPGQGQSQFLAANFLDQVGHQPVDDLQNVVALDEGHLDVDLGELGLPVSSQVLVPEAAGHLHVAVVAGDHQDLLVDLGTLRQGVEAPGVHSTGDQVVASSLGRTAAQHRGLDLEKSVLVEVVACRLGHLVPQHEVLLKLIPAEIQKTVFQPQFLVGQLDGGRFERRRLALAEDHQPYRLDLDLSGGQLRIDVLGAADHLALDLDHVLASQCPCYPLHLFVVREIEDDLGDAVAVAEIDEDQSTMVTVILDPATECYGLSDVIGSKFAAGVGTQHGGAVGYWRGNARCGHGATIIEVAGCAAKGG